MGLHRVSVRIAAQYAADGGAKKAAPWRGRQSSRLEENFNRWSIKKPPRDGERHGFIDRRKKAPRGAKKTPRPEEVLGAAYRYRTSHAAG
jgi:hypothetical protein